MMTSYKSQPFLYQLKIKFLNKIRITEVNYIYYKELPFFDENKFLAKIVDFSDMVRVLLVLLKFL